ncbi:hypothetical protein ACGF0K_32775 [Streptomyces sp. NPDC048156]|uniref:hypothetical protein n=1 Tax=Streptomyces sp. NPDC048156 TaxID=3365502 RepID=UPI00371E912F
MFDECLRVLAPGGHMLLAFKVGDRRRQLDQAYGHELSLDVYWMSPERVSGLMSEAGLVMDAQMIREPDESEKPRQGRQGFFFAHKPKGPGGEASD